MTVLVQMQVSNLKNTLALIKLHSVTVQGVLDHNSPTCLVKINKMTPYQWMVGPITFSVPNAH